MTMTPEADRCPPGRHDIPVTELVTSGDELRASPRNETRTQELERIDRRIDGVTRFPSCRTHAAGCGHEQVFCHLRTYRKVLVPVFRLHWRMKDGFVIRTAANCYSPSAWRWVGERSAARRKVGSRRTRQRTLEGEAMASSGDRPETVDSFSAVLFVAPPVRGPIDGWS